MFDANNIFPSIISVISHLSIYHTSEQYFLRALIGQLGGDQPSTIHLRAAEEKQNGFCLYIVTNKVTLWAASYSACVVNTKTIIPLNVGGSSGYLCTCHWKSPPPPPTPGRSGAYVGICKCFDDLPVPGGWGNSSLQTIYILDGDRITWSIIQNGGF